MRLAQLDVINSAPDCARAPERCTTESIPSKRRGEGDEEITGTYQLSGESTEVLDMTLCFIHATCPPLPAGGR